LIAIKGESEKGKKKQKVGGGEKHYGDWKVFNRHMGVVIENLLVAMRLWWLKTFQSPYD
jgi:hypothetical protein